MNWQNYDRLVKHLNTMDAGRFDYERMSASITNDGCVACQCLGLEGRPMDNSAPDDIQRFLNVKNREARFLYGWGVEEVEATSLTVWDCGVVPVDEIGIAEALRRLAVVAARYQRPSEEPEAVAVVPG